jgi:Zn-dependent protease
MSLIGTISVWLLPLLVAITFHEAAHGYVAQALGDQTAARQGRVTLNPISHIDPIGTVLLPGLLLLAHSPFLFGYAKPVPVAFGALRTRRIGMIAVAAAGPLMNLALAVIAGASFHLVHYFPETAAIWIAQNLKNAILINVILAVFNLFPLLPLDGGRIVVGLLPVSIARPFSRLEPFGLLIFIGLLIVLPLFGPQLGVNLDFVSSLISTMTEKTLRFILAITGNI